MFDLAQAEARMGGDDGLAVGSDSTYIRDDRRTLWLGGVRFEVSPGSWVTPTAMQSVALADALLGAKKRSATSGITSRRTIRTWRGSPAPPMLERTVAIVAGRSLLDLDAI